MYRDTPKLARPGSDDNPTTASFLYFWRISFVVISPWLTFFRPLSSRKLPEIPSLHSPLETANRQAAVSCPQAYQSELASIYRQARPSLETFGGSVDFSPGAASLHTRAWARTSWT